MPTAGEATQLVSAVESLGVSQLLSLFLGLLGLLAGGGVILLMLRTAKPFLDANLQAMRQYGEAVNKMSDVAERSTRAFEATEEAIRTLSNQSVESLKVISTQLTTVAGDAAKDRKDLRNDVMDALRTYQEQVTAGFGDIKREVGALVNTSLPDIAGKLDDVLRRLNQLETLVKTAVPAATSEVTEATPEQTPPATDTPMLKPSETKGEADAGHAAGDQP